MLHFQYNYNAIRVQGFSSLLILIILAVLSIGIIALAVSKTNRQVTSLVNQQTDIKVDSSITFALQEAVLNFLATGNRVNQAINIADNTLMVTNNTVDVKKNSKDIKGITLSVTGLTQQIGIIEHKVALLQMRRLERHPTTGVNHVSVSDLQATIFEYFNLSLTDFKNLRTNASYDNNNCKNLSFEQHGFIWVSGTCDLQSINLGSANRPVIIVIENGNVTLTNSYIYGLLVHLCSDNQTHTSQISSNSLIFGALITSCLGPNDLSSAIYDEELLNILIEHRDNLTTQFVEGSWLSQ